MNVKSITTAFFSPTGNTRKYLKEMTSESGIPVKVLDMTLPKLDNPQPFSFDDLVVVGAPVYGGRIPTVAMERFTKLEGNNTPCIILACFGNRAFDDALLEFAELFRKNGFVMYGGAAVVGRHTYGSIQIDRPNKKDLQEAKDFFARIMNNNSAEPRLSIPGNIPYLAKGSKGRFFPTTDISVCRKCGMCVRLCPTGAIAQDCMTIDSEKCLSCFRCIRNCPAKAKQMTSTTYKEFAEMLSKKLEKPKENVFFYPEE